MLSRNDQNEKRKIHKKANEKTSNHKHIVRDNRWQTDRQEIEGGYTRDNGPHKNSVLLYKTVDRWEICTKWEKKKKKKKLREKKKKKKTHATLCFQRKKKSTETRNEKVMAPYISIMTVK